MGNINIGHAHVASRGGSGSYSFGDPFVVDRDLLLGLERSAKPIFNIITTERTFYIFI